MRVLRRCVKKKRLRGEWPDGEAEGLLWLCSRVKWGFSAATSGGALASGEVAAANVGADRAADKTGECEAVVGGDFLQLLSIVGLEA